jgi:hypothetical protein
MAWVLIRGPLSLSATSHEERIHLITAQCKVRNGEPLRSDLFKNSITGIFFEGD